MSVETELFGIERPGRRRTLGLKVRNTSQEPLGALCVSFEWENEQHQPDHGESRTASGGTSFKSVGRFTGKLVGGGEQLFYLDEQYLEKEVLGRVAALSPERYWVTVAADGKELTRIDGRLVGGVLDGLERA